MLKKSTSIFVILIVLACSALAQRNPVRWEYSAKKVDGASNTYAVHLTATIEEGWHIYAQHQPKDAIAQPTRILFTKNPLVAIHGKTDENGKLEKHSIEALGIEQYQYADKVDFVQLVQVKNGDIKTSVSGILTFQACTDEMCLLPAELHFSVSL